MAYVIPETASLNWQMDYVAGAAAAADALGMKELAQKLDAHYAELRAARDRVDDDRRGLSRASAHVRVADARWDRGVLDISSNALLLSNRQADQQPYKNLFGEVTANDMQKLGPAKATVMGDKLVSKVRVLAVAALNALADALDAARDTLLNKVKDRNAAEVKLAAHSMERVQWLQKTQAAADGAEVAILTAHPGRKDLVRAVLQVPRVERSGGATLGSGDGGTTTETDTPVG